MNISPASVLRFFPLKFRNSMMHASEDELKELSDAYAHFGELSAYAVVAGVAVELASAIFTVNRAFQGVIPDILILLGVAGEVFSGSRMRVASEALGRFAEQRVAEANYRAAEANEKAEREHLARLKIEERLAPRLLAPEQQDRIVEKLRQFATFPGTKRRQMATVLALSQDAESIFLSDQIASVLLRAGWQVSREKEELAFPARAVWGVLLLGSSTNHGHFLLNSLWRTLADEGLAVMAIPDGDAIRWTDEQIASDPRSARIAILVGNKKP